MIAGLEYAMQSRAKFGLVIVAVSFASLAQAHAPGVTHTYEQGEPVITVRLVPDEAAVARAKRTNPLEQPAARINSSNEMAIEPNPAASTEPVETLAPGEELPGDGVDTQVTPVPARQESASQDVPQRGASVARYPSARPVIKPNTETGVGGALDLAPPVAEEPSQPRPMRLNSLERSRRVVERARPQPQPREERRRVRRLQPDTATAEAAKPAQPDPLDMALPPRVIDTDAGTEPANAMQLPPPKAEDRVAAGN